MKNLNVNLIKSLTVLILTISSPVFADYKGVRGFYEFESKLVDGYSIDCYSSSDIALFEMYDYVKKPLKFCTSQMVGKILKETPRAATINSKYKVVQITKNDNTVIPVYVNTTKKEIYVDQTAYRKYDDKGSIGKFIVDTKKNKICFPTKVDAYAFGGMDITSALDCVVLQKFDENNRLYSHQEIE